MRPDFLVKKLLSPVNMAEESAPGGSVTLESDDTISNPAEDTGFIPDGDNIEEQFLKHLAETDPEYQDLKKDISPADENKENLQEEKPEDIPEEKPEDNPEDNPETEENTEKKDDDDDYEYPDDVIPGLKGEHFKILPKEAQEAIAKYHDANLSMKTTAEENNTVVSILKNDPVAKHRLEMIKAGKAFAEYKMPDVTEAEVKKILETEDQASAIKLIQKSAERIARVAVDNERIREETKKRIEETNKQGENILREAGNLHPDLFDQKNNIDKRLKDFSSADTAGTEENKTYNGYHQKIVDFCQNRGYRYVDIAKMKPAELYALVAVNEGWPIAINTQKRDAAMLSEATSKALRHFRISRRGREIAQGMRSNADSTGRRPVSDSHKVDGIDVVKLATDNDYHDKVLNSKFGNPNWIDRVSELRNKGEEIIQKKRRKGGSG